MNNLYQRGLYRPLNYFNNPFLASDYNIMSNNLSSNLNPFDLNQKFIDLQESINFLENNINNDKKQEKKKENKFLLFFKSHNFTNDNEIIKRDEQINKDKKFFDLLSNNLEDDMKCGICLGRYKDPLLCPNCHHFVCRNCLKKWYEEDKENCVYCRKNMDFGAFIDIFAFKKIIPFLDLLKENNNNYFNNIMKNNIDNEIVLCSNKIHEKIDDNDQNNTNDNEEIDKEKKYNNQMNEIKASYYCLDCNKPYCSDCICLNENNNNEHNNDHFVFNIDILNEIKYFDLLYEKENNKTIEKLKKITDDINKEIETMNKKKNNFLLFIEFIKNTYVSIIDNKINNLKDILKKCESEINKIHNKFNEIDGFINIMKSSQNIRNSKNIKEIDKNLNALNNFDKYPEKINNDISIILQFKGLFHLKENYDGIVTIKNQKFESEILCCENISLIITKDYYKKRSKSINPFLTEYNDKNNNLELNNEINDDKYKILIIYRKHNQYYNEDSNFGLENNKLLFPVLFDNENKYISFNEIKIEDELFLIQRSRKKDQYNIFYNSNNNNNFKYFRAFVECDRLIINNEDNNEIKICFRFH